LAKRRRRTTAQATRDDEYRRFLDAAPSELYRDLFTVMRHAGLRVSEVVALRWDQLDLEACQLHIKGKGGVERYVDVLVPVEEVLRRRSEVHRSAVEYSTSQPFVFPTSTGHPPTTRTVQRVLKRLREELGIPRERATPHKLRHAYGTGLARKGVPVHIIKDQMGHADIATTSVYLHSAGGEVRRLVDEA